MKKHKLKSLIAFSCFFMIGLFVLMGLTTESMAQPTCTWQPGVQGEDTKCDTPNACNSVCIWNDCRTRWPDNENFETVTIQCGPAGGFTSCCQASCPDERYAITSTQCSFGSSLSMSIETNNIHSFSCCGDVIGLGTSGSATCTLVR